VVFEVLAGGALAAGFLAVVAGFEAAVVLVVVDLEVVVGLTVVAGLGAGAIAT
jgi:hypothetical protein